MTATDFRVIESGVRSEMKTEFIYVGIRVKDLEESIKFYTKVLGMKLMERQRIEETKGDVAGLQSGEMKFALESGKRVYGVWLPPNEPSVFFTRYCSLWFRTPEAVFQQLWADVQGSVEQHARLSVVQP